MRNNLKGIAAATILMLLVVCSLPIARPTLAFDPNPDQTWLDVRLPGAQPQWGNSRTIHALHSLTFRWKTDIATADHGRWQILDYKPQSNGMNENPFALSPLPLPLALQFQPFTIDFAQLQQQYPNKIPADAPVNGKDYWIRIVPWNADETMVAGPISDVVKITYVKSPPPPPNPPTFTFVAEFWLGGHFVDIGYGTNKPVVPLITVSTSAPVTDAKGNPAFPKNAKIASSSLPILGGYEKDGEVELRNLTPKTHYHYIIEAKDEKGQFAYKTGQFTTATRHVEVGFDKIFMIDDSDGAFSGAGDLVFAFFVNDVNVLGNNKRLPATGEMDFPTGQTKSFEHIVREIMDPPNTISARVNGYDDDDCAIFTIHPFCDCETPGDVLNSHMKNFTCKDGSGENAAATTTLNVPDVVDRSQFGVEFLLKEFTMTADNGHLKFKVFGRMSIDYR